MDGCKLDVALRHNGCVASFQVIEPKDDEYVADKPMVGKEA